MLRSSNGRATVLHTVDRGSIPLRSTSFISLKRYQVAYTVWGRVVQVRILVGRPSYASVAPMVEQRTENSCVAGSSPA